MEKKINRCRSYFDCLEAEPSAVDCHVEKIKQSHLDYNERGRVVVVEDPDFDLQALIQSYSDDGDIVSQIQRLARGDVSVSVRDPASLMYGDVSTAPDNPVEQAEWLAAAPSSSADAASALGGPSSPATSDASPDAAKAEAPSDDHKEAQ